MTNAAWEPLPFVVMRATFQLCSATMAALPAWRARRPWACGVRPRFLYPTASAGTSIHPPPACRVSASWHATAAGEVDPSSPLPDAVQIAVEVVSTQNPRIKAVRHLLRRRMREREGRLLLEGHRLVADALGSARPDAPIHTIVATRQAAARLWPALSTATSVARDALLVATPDVVASVCDTVTPQGVVAVVGRPSTSVVPGSTLLLALDGVADPGNVGTLLRSAAAAGADGVVLTKGCADVWSPKALRAGMGAQLRLPVLTGFEPDGVVAWARGRGLRLRVADGSGVMAYDGVDWAAPSVLVVGGEAEGPSAALLAAADEVVAIPMLGEVESLNAAVAGSVVLYEARRQRSVASGSGI